MTTNYDTQAPVRSKPWPSWPVWADVDQNNLLAVLGSGNWGGVLERTAPSTMVTDFEAAWSSTVRVTHTITCCNGSISLEAALGALGVGAGDEVIVPAYTFVATAASALAVNALPVFVDIDPGTTCIDPKAVEDAISPRTAAIIAVHLAGHPADMDELVAIAARHGLPLIEDAAQAHGAAWSGRPVGGIGALGCWSFQSSKNLTAGEGGAVTTNDDKLAELVTSLCNYGRVEGGAWYEHHRHGDNFRITQWQGAMLLAGLSRLPQQIERRELSAARLDKELGDIEGVRPMARDPRATVHAHHLYQFRFEPDAFGGIPRSEFIARLNREGVPAAVGYPFPALPATVVCQQGLRCQGDALGAGVRCPLQYEDQFLPACEAACDEIVWLPQWVLLAPAEEMSDVAEAITRIQNDARGS